MDTQKHKASPLEFLAQLKAGSKSSKHLPKEKPSSGEVKLDLSDLAAPAGNGDAAAAQPEAATAVAVAQSPDAPAKSAPNSPAPAGPKEAPADRPADVPAAGKH